MRHISERLSQRYKILGRVDSWNGCQPAPNIDPNRTHRRLIANAEPDRMGVIVSKLTKVNIRIDVPPVIENHSAQILFERHRETQFRVDDCQHIAANRNADQRTGGRYARIAAHADGPLRSCSIDRKSAKRLCASREKTLAERHVSSRKWLRKSHAKIVGPDEPRSDLFIKR